MVYNGAQIHLFVNHVPVIGIPILSLALAVAIKIKSLEIKRFVLLATSLISLSVLAPQWSGESALKVIEDRPGVSEQLIEEHEELAERATVLSLMTSGLATVAFFMQRSRAYTLTYSLPLV